MDKPIVIPIVTPQINWDDFVVTIYQQTKRSPTRVLTTQAGDLASFLESLASFSNQEVNYQQLFFSFLIEICKEDYIELLKNTRLSCVDNINTSDCKYFVIASGNLQEWLDACYKFSNNNFSFNLRYVFDCIALYFEQRFKIIKFKKQTLSDNTFTIIPPNNKQLS